EGSQTVNGKIEINEDIAHAKVTMTMPDPAKLANKLSNVAITDNYSKFANLVTDRKSTRLNSSHVSISYAVFCLKKKKEAIRILCQKVDGQSARNSRGIHSCKGDLN